MRYRILFLANVLSVSLAAPIISRPKPEASASLNLGSSGTAPGDSFEGVGAVSLADNTNGSEGTTSPPAGEDVWVSDPTVDYNTLVDPPTPPITSRQDRFTGPDGGFYTAPVVTEPVEEAPARYDSPDGGFARRQGAEPDIWTPPASDAPKNAASSAGAAAAEPPAYDLGDTPVGPDTNVWVPEADTAIAARQDRFSQPDGGFYVPEVVAPVPATPEPVRYDSPDGGFAKRQDRFSTPDGGFWVPPPAAPAPVDPAPARFDSPDGGFAKRQVPAPTEVWNPPAVPAPTENWAPPAVPAPTENWAPPAVPAPTENWTPPAIPAPTEEAATASTRPSDGWSIATRQARHTTPNAIRPKKEKRQATTTVSSGVLGTVQVSEPQSEWSDPALGEGYDTDYWGDVRRRQDRYTQPDGGFPVEPVGPVVIPADPAPERFDGPDGGFAKRGV